MSESKTVRVTVRLKKGVLDPQGEAIGRSLRRLGFDGVQEVRVGKVVEMKVDSVVAQADGEKMAGDLLANGVIEDFQVELP